MYSPPVSIGEKKQWDGLLWGSRMHAQYVNRIRDHQVRLTPVWGTPEIGEVLVMRAPWDGRSTVGGYVRDACVYVKRMGALLKGEGSMTECCH